MKTDLQQLQHELDEGFERGTVVVRRFEPLDDVDGTGEDVVRVIVHLEPARERETWRGTDLAKLRRFVSEAAQKAGIQRRVMTTLEVEDPASA